MLLAALMALTSAALFALARDVDDREKTVPAATRRLRWYLGRDAEPGRRRTVFAAADRYLLQTSFGAALERQLTQAGLAVSVSGMLLATAAGIAIAGGIAGAVGGFPLALVAVPGAALSQRAVLQRARRVRVRQLETQLPGALDMLVGQLRSHRSIGEALSEIAQWIPRPLGGEFSQMAEELRVGEPLSQALARFRDRVGAAAVPAMVTAIIVADRTGADLVECLARQAAAARTQIAFRHEVSAMTAHARATGATLALLPLVVAAAMLLLEPGAFEPMIGTTAGRMLLGAAGMMELIGWQTIRWMIRRVEL